MRNANVCAMNCPYCGELAEKVTGDVIYPHRRDLRHLIFYRCVPCDARVGTHSDSGEPLGTLAKEELRGLRQEAHGVLDRLWRKSKGGLLFRGFVYTWLQLRLNMDSTPHIGVMNEEQCREVIALAAEIKTNMKETKAIWGVGG